MLFCACFVPRALNASPRHRWPLRMDFAVCRSMSTMLAESVLIGKAGDIPALIRPTDRLVGPPTARPPACRAGPRDMPKGLSASSSRRDFQELLFKSGVRGACKMPCAEAREDHSGLQQRGVAHSPTPPPPTPPTTAPPPPSRTCDFAYSGCGVGSCGGANYEEAKRVRG